MRNTKFRGIRIDNGEWVEGSLLILLDGTPVIVLEAAQTGKTHPHYPAVCLGVYYKVIPETVGQFTGLKDKNGFEIYEGDIFKIIYADVPNGFKLLGRDKKIIEVYGVVIYKWSGFYLEHKEPVGKEIRYGNLKKFLENPKEVIGNIHEHKHLLERSE